MPPADPVVISIRDLRRSCGNVEAVRGVSFDVNRGEVFGLLGPNGARPCATASPSWTRAA